MILLLNTTYLYPQNIYLTQYAAPTPYPVRFSSSVYPAELELQPQLVSRVHNPTLRGLAYPVATELVTPEKPHADENPVC